MARTAMHEIDWETLWDLRVIVRDAREKHPLSDRVEGWEAELMMALIEEVLELVRAVNDKEGGDRVRAEALDVACVAVRIHEELYMP